MKILKETRLRASLEARRGSGSFFLFSDPPHKEAPSEALATIITDQLSSNDSGE
jgi:hypothetical protein